MANTKRINYSWWIDQINSGIAFRKKYAYEDSWPVWVEMYRGNWADGVLPLNFFFMLLRSIVPRVYFRNPAISISPGKPGNLNAAFSQILGRIDNKLLVQMKVKQEMKRMAQDCFLFGTAGGKLGFGGQFTPTPSEGGTESPLSRRGRIEYMDGIKDNMPWFSRFHPKYLIVPSESASARDVQWKCHVVERPIEDVKGDPRLKNTYTLRPSKTEFVSTSSINVKVGKPQDMVTLYEIRDKKFRRVFIISPDSKSVLYEGSDAMQTDEGDSIFTMSFNDDPEFFWGIPDAKIIEPQQLEMNEIRTQTMKHRRAALVKILAEKGAIDLDQAEKMTDEEVMAIVFCNDLEKVKPTQVSEIPRDLILAGDGVHRDVREQMGFSRNQMGDAQMQSGKNTTATEAQIVQQASEIRIDERRDIMADVLVDITKGVHNVIFNYWSGEQVIDVVGPGGVPLWVKFTPEMLRGGAYEVGVDPDTAIPTTRSSREQKAMIVYERLKENPLIDPLKLTAYLLREMHGVQYDDMIRGLPEGAGMSPSKPLNIEEFGQMIQKGRDQGLPVPGQGGF